MIFCDIMGLPVYYFFFFFNDTATTEIYTLSLHDALPISKGALQIRWPRRLRPQGRARGSAESDSAKSHRNFDLRCRSEEHTSELQSPCNLVCRLLLEKKKNTNEEYPVT